VTAALLASGPGQAFVVQTLGFVVVVVVLGKFVVPALKKILGGRTAEIEQTFQKIEKDTADTAKAMAEIKDRLTHLQEESARRTKEALDEAQRHRDQALSEAKVQAEAALERARRDIETEREKAVFELREEATALTLKATDALVQATMTEAIHEKLVASYMNQMDAVKRP